MNQPSSFYDLGIAPNILAVLNRLGFKIPTPIQEKSIPIAIEGRDMIGVAQTGTGKTLAFAVPLMQAALRGRHGLVILPTRELALQVGEVFHKIGSTLGVRCAILIGGESMYRQTQSVRRNPQIIIGTPGRIIDHLEQKTLTLKSIGALVLDEADRMLDMGFAPQLKKILEAIPRERHTMLFSATMPPDIVSIAQKYMNLPTRIEVAPPGTPAARITQELFFVERDDKSRLLEKILSEYRGSILIFCRLKYGAKKIAMNIRAMGYTAAEIHSNRTLNQRRMALEGFRNGVYRILVATDIAARGIDVKGIELVINYDLPQSPEDYVHRIGRTGRVGGAGHAISFALPNEKGDVRMIERLIKATLPLSALPEMPPKRFHAALRPEFMSHRPSGPANRPSRSHFGGHHRSGSASGGPRRPSRSGWRRR